MRTTKQPPGMMGVAAALLAAVGAAAPPAVRSEEPAVSPREAMTARGFIRYRGSWRTVQEIDLIERNEKASLAQKEWGRRLERLRKDADRPATADRAAEEIREISDPFAVPALGAAVAKETAPVPRGWYVEALARIGSPDAIRTLVAVALDHPDPETRIAAVERLRKLGPHHAKPTLAAALGSPDNAQVNRAAEALGRLGGDDLIAPLIDALQTRHVVGADAPDGQMSATFTPSGGGLSMGGGPKQSLVVTRNTRVLEALVAITGTNFEWDADGWRRWLAARNAPPADFDPRRG
jgi:HEAT repeat protein